MAKVWKEVIRTGRHVYDDPATGQSRVLDATPELVKYWFDQGKLMRSAGLSIPIPLEHDESAKPMTAAEKAAKQFKDNAGFIEDFDLRRVKEKGPDGKETEVDAVFGLHDLDPDVVKNHRHSIRWVSPWISSFVDGEGRQWNGVISHSAITTRPRIARQEPFDLSAMLSQVPTTAAFDPAKVPVGKGVALSRAGLLRPDGKPAYPLAFSLWGGAKLAVEEIVKEKKKELPKAEPKGESKPEPKVEPPGEPGEPQPAPADGMPVEESLVDPDGDIAIWDVICDLLCLEGIELPEGTNGENFEERLYKAIIDKKKAGNPGDPMSDPTNPTPPAAPTPPAEPKVEKPPIYMSQQPVALSLEAIQKIPDDTLRNIALSLHHQQEKNAALEKNAFGAARAARQARLDKILPRLQQGARDKLMKQAEDAKFSLGADGVVVDELSDRLDVIEDASRFQIPDLLLNPAAGFSVMPHPKELDGGTSEERRQAVVNEQLTNSGRAPAYTENGKK